MWLQLLPSTLLPPPLSLRNRSLLYHVPQSARQVRRRLHVAKAPSDDSPIISGTIPKYGKGMAVQQYAEVRRTFTPTDVIQFGHLVGDSNPLHSSIVLSDHGEIDNNNDTIPHLFNNDTELVNILRQAGLIQFVDNPFSSDMDIPKSSRPLVHGMLASSLFSCIFGTLIPGSIYRSQNLTFHSPIFANDHVIGRVLVTKVRPLRGGSPSIATHATEIPEREEQSKQGGLLVICDTTVLRNEEYSSHPHHNTISKDRRLCIQGHAHVWLPTGTTAEEEATNAGTAVQELATRCFDE
jgi:acyl dehydratase